MATYYVDQSCIAVEHAASDDAVVFHLVREGAVLDGAVVFHTAHVLEGAVLYGAVVYHPAHVLEGAVLYGGVGAFVCHTARVLEGALLYGAAVCHTARFLEDAARDYSSGVVCHFFLKGAAGNCRRRLNRTRHRLCGTEIKRSTRQSQCLGDVIVTPVGAIAGDFALVGSLRPALLHDEVGAGDRFVQHHVLVVRHGEGHDRLVAAVAAVAVAIADGLAVQAEDLGAGSDGHFLRRGRGPLGHDDVGVPNRKHTVGFRDFSTGVGFIPSNRVGICCRFCGRIVVEHAAHDSSVAAVCHTAREGAAIDRSVVVRHCSLEGSARDDSSVVVYHFFLKGAVLYGTVVFHFLLKGAARNLRRRLNFNRTLHSRSGPRFFTGVLGMGGVEIKRSIRQSQCLGAAIVTPALAAGADRPAARHDEPAGAEHHVLVVRHGEFHGRLFACIGVAALAVAIADGLAVQAVDFGIGSDGHNLHLGRGPFSHDDVGLPIRRPIQRHTVDFRDLGFGGGRIPGDGVDTCYPVQTCFAVEHTTGYLPLIFHTAREGATSDVSSGVVCHFFIEGSTSDISSVVVYHIALEGSARDTSGAVCHFFLKGAVLDCCVDSVVHIAIEGSALDRSCEETAIKLFIYVCHCSIKGAVGNVPVIFHTFLKGAAGNLRTRFNRTFHSRIGRCFIGSVLGIGQTEIKFPIYTLQNQFAVRVRRVFFTVLPAGATARGVAVVGADRVAVLHDEFAGAEHHVLVRHGKGHGRLVVFIGVVAFVDGLAVQAVDVDAGSDDYGGAFVGVEVPWLFRVLRSILVPRAFAVHLEHTAIRYGDLVGFGGQPRLAVERAASHFAAVPRQARREGSTRDFSFGVYHCFIEDASGNFHIQSNHNRTLHRRCGRCSLGLALGMGGAEIKRSIIQSQCIGAAIVIPAVATGAVRTVRQTVLHDELWGGSAAKAPRGSTESIMLSARIRLRMRFFIGVVLLICQRLHQRSHGRSFLGPS